jgi:hypothetical protein
VVMVQELCGTVYHVMSDGGGVLLCTRPTMDTVWCSAVHVAGTYYLLGS